MAGVALVAGVVTLAVVAWRTTDAPPVQRAGTIVPVPVAVGFGEQASVMLEDGRILIPGGETDPFTAEPSAIAYLLSPETHSIERVADMKVPRSYHTATLLADGTVLISGGEGAELFDPRTRASELLDDRPIDRRAHAAIRLLDGSVLIVGGLDSAFQPVLAIERYLPDTQTFEQLPTGVNSPSLRGVLLPGGNVFLRGGTHFWIFDPETMSLSEPVSYQFANEPAVALDHDGRVILLGGTILDYTPGQESVEASTDIVAVDATTLAQSLIGHLAEPRHRSGVALVEDGRIVIAGGSPDSHTDGGFLASIEVVDSVTGISTLGPPMSQGRYRIEVVASGRGVAFLGSPTRNPETSIDIYVP